MEKLISIDSKEYRNIHDWIRRRKKYIVECKKCGAKNVRLDNALIAGKIHEKCEDNYIKLCRKCHYHYDNPNGFIHTEKSKSLIGQYSSKRIFINGVSEKFIMARKGTNISEEHKLIISNKMSGENHHQSKLKEKDVIEILNNSTDSNIVLAKKYNVTKENISNIKLRKTWKKIKL